MNSVKDLLVARKEHTSTFVLHIDRRMQATAEWKEVARFLEQWGCNISLAYHDFLGETLSPMAWVESDM